MRAFRILLLVGVVLAGSAGALRAQASRPATPAASYRGQAFPQLRTPLEALPVEGQAELLRLETLLQRAYVAMLAEPNTSFYPQVVADVIQQAAAQAAAVVPTWNHDAYQREAAFYSAEQARRAAAAKP